MIWPLVCASNLFFGHQFFYVLFSDFFVSLDLISEWVHFCIMFVYSIFSTLVFFPLRCSQIFSLSNHSTFLQHPITVSISLRKLFFMHLSGALHLFLLSVVHFLLISIFVSFRSVKCTTIRFSSTPPHKCRPRKLNNFVLFYLFSVLFIFAV